MSDQPEALRLADRLEGRWALHPEMQQAAAELRRLHDQIERLAAEVANRNRRALAGDEAVAGLAKVHAYYEGIEAERDAAVAEVERLKGVNYDLAGELMVLRATKQMQAAIDAVKEDK